MATTTSTTRTSFEEEIFQQIKAGIMKDAPPTKKEEPPVVIKKAERKAEKGQVMYSKLIGKVPAKMEDFPVTVLTSKDVPEEIRAFIPAADDAELDGYVPQLEQLYQLILALEDGDKVVISGPTGSGKTSMVKYACQKTGRPFMRINGNGDIESSAIFGQLVVEGGGTVWRDGVATEASKYGGVLCVDEWEVLPPEITMGFQAVLESGGTLFLKEKPGSSEEKLVVPHKQSRFVFCGNTVGQGDDSGAFAGTTVQNTATIDRFDTAIHLGYLQPSHEEAILTNKIADLDKSIAKLMIQYASLVRTAYMQSNIGLTMSPRTLINWGRKVVRYGKVKVALEYSFLNKLRDSDKKIATEMLTKVFGKIE